MSEQSQGGPVFEPAPLQRAVAGSAGIEIGVEQRHTAPEQRFEDARARAHRLQRVDRHREIVEHIEALPRARISCQKIEPLLGLVPHPGEVVLGRGQARLGLRENLAPALVNSRKILPRSKDAPRFAAIGNLAMRLRRGRRRQQRFQPAECRYPLPVHVRHRGMRIGLHRAQEADHVREAGIAQTLQSRDPEPRPLARLLGLAARNQQRDLERRVARVVGIRALRFAKALPRALDVAAVSEHRAAALQRRGAQLAVAAFEYRLDQPIAFAFFAEGQIAIHQLIEQRLELADKWCVALEPRLDQRCRALVVAFFLPLAGGVIHRDRIDATRRQLNEMLLRQAVEDVPQHIVAAQIERARKGQAAALVFFPGTAKTRLVSPRLGNAPGLEARVRQRHRVVYRDPHRPESKPRRAGARIEPARHGGREMRTCFCDPVEKSRRVAGFRQYFGRSLKQQEEFAVVVLGTRTG